MKYGMMMPRGKLDAKPPHGASCTHCGLCCEATLCDLAQHVFGHEQGPCPALERDADGKSGCGLVNHPDRWLPVRAVVQGVRRMSEAALHLIGAGQGCDARFNGEPVNEAFRWHMREFDRKTRARTREAKRLWGVE